MFLLAWILFHVEKLLRGLTEGLFTDSLVFDHDFRVICIYFTQSYICFIPFQSVKQAYGFFHLLLNRQAIILCLYVQIGS